MYGFALRLFRFLSASFLLRRWMLRLLHPTWLVGVVGLIIDNQERVLLFHHTYRRDNHWSMPGGFMSGDEYPARALIREVREESGLEIEVGRPLDTVTLKDLSAVEIVFEARLVDGIFTPSAEVDMMIAVGPEDDYSMVKQNQRRVIDDYFKKRRNS